MIKSSKVKLQLMISSPDMAETISLEGEEFVFGRNTASTVHLNDPAFSRSHFKMTIDNTRIKLIDLGSSNGTFINGTQVSVENPAYLNNGDVITINNSSVSVKVLNVSWPSSAAAEPTIIHRNEPVNPVRTSGTSAIDHLSEEIIREANLRVEEIIYSANQEAQDIMIAAQAQSDKLIADKQALADQYIEKQVADRMAVLKKELEAEKEKKLLEMHEQFDSDKEKFHAELEQAALSIVSDHEKRKIELNLELESVVFKTSELEKNFSLEVDKQKRLLDQQLADQKKELVDLIKNQEEEKKKQIQLIEAQHENKRFQLQNELDAIELKITAAKTEFSTLYDNYNNQKQIQVKSLDNLVAEKNKTAQEIKSLTEELTNQKIQNTKYLSENKVSISSMLAEVEKVQKTKNEVDNAFKVSQNALADLDKKRSTMQAEIKTEEDLIQQKKQQQLAIDAEIRKLTSEQADINSKLLPLKNELQELIKKNDAASRQNNDLRNEYAKDVTTLKASFLQMKKDLEAEMHKHKVAEEERLQNLTRHELNQINKIKEDSLRIVLDLEDSITKELSNATSKVFATTIGMTKFREIAPDFEQSIRASLQAGVLKLLKNELTPTDLTKKKNLSGTQKSWKPMAIGMTLSALIFGGIPLVYKQVQEQNDPARLQREADERAAALPVIKKFTPEKVSKLGENFVDSVVYTHNFYETITQEKFRSGLMKEGSVYMYKQWKIDEEKSIQSYAMILSLIDALHEKSEKIDPDYEKHDIKKMADMEKETMKKLESILGNGVRLEAALKFQNRFYEDYVMNEGITSTSAASQ